MQHLNDNEEGFIIILFCLEVLCWNGLTRLLADYPAGVAGEWGGLHIFLFYLHAITIFCGFRVFNSFEAGTSPCHTRLSCPPDVVGVDMKGIIGYPSVR
jgi:hypothetical protein